MRLMLATALATVALTGCMTMPPPSAGMPAEPPPREGGVCNAEAARQAIGKAATEANIEMARRDSGASLVRVLRPGMVATADFRPDRLTIDVNEREAIVGIRCT